jgi:hypothetical protein
MNLSILDFTLRLGAALLMGAAVGLERQWRQRMAGTRTNALVAAGAAAFVMCAFMVRDTSRSEAQIVSYVVSGVGFLGGGVIFKDAGSVRGLFRCHRRNFGVGKSSARSDSHRRYSRHQGCSSAAFLSSLSSGNIK